MAITRLGRQVKRSYHSYGFCVKLSAVVILGLCFVFVWSIFSNFSVVSQRDTFDDISVPVSISKVDVFRTPSSKVEPKKGQESGNKSFKSGLKENEKKRVNESVALEPKKSRESAKVEPVKQSGGKDSKLSKKGKSLENKGSEEEVVKETVEDEKDEGEGEDLKNDGNDDGERKGDLDLFSDEDLDQEVDEEDEGLRKKEKKLGPLFDPKARYTWKLCSTKSKHNYIPCIDIESFLGRFQSYRHHERSCPKSSVMCLVPLPHDGYDTPVHWPESKTKILYKNVAHPKLAAFVKTRDWVVDTGEYLTFPQNQTVFKGGVQHYLESIEEMVPDLEWGKNIRIVLDIGCKDSSFSASLLEKNVLTLTLGLKDDLVDLTQVALERGFPAIVSPFATRRLPFPSGVFDAVHCGECAVSWQSNGGKLILEMNRILRPGGYFILSNKHNSIEAEEALTTLTASICWNIMADKTDEVSDIGSKIYQKPESNDIYQLRRKKIPPLCKDNDKPDAACYVPLKNCLHTIPEAIEQRGNEWPTEWPKMLNTYPESMNSREKLIADSAHWNAIVNNSYLMDWH